MRWVIVVGVVACSSPKSTHVEPPIAAPAPVVADDSLPFDPPAPTFRLPRHFTPKAHDVTLAIDPAKDTFTGSMRIDGTLDQKSAVIWLHADLSVKKVMVTQGGATREIVVAAKGGLLELRGGFAKGDLSIAIDYEGKYETGDVGAAYKNVFNGDAYVYSFFEPTNARRVFPTIDEPDRKTPWTVTLDVPSALVAVGNMPVAETKELGGGTKRVRFAPTPPLSSYLVAFGVGPFEILDAGRTKQSKTPMRILVPKGQTARGAFAKRIVPIATDALESYLGIAHPYPKLDYMFVPQFGGAMEHAGLVTSDPMSGLLDAKASQREQRSSAHTIVHEIAHQWFGDYVTPPFWDDAWLKEAFATFFEFKIGVVVEPAWHDERAHLSRKHAGFDNDELATSRAMRQPLKSADEIHGVYDGVTYLKGGAILGYIERYVGEDAFRRGLAEYLRAHAHGNATMDDVVTALERAAGKSLAKAVSAFVDQPGVPVVTAKLACDGKPRIAVSQQRLLRPGAATPTPTKPWPLPMCIAFEQAGKRAETCTLYEPQMTELALPATSCPKWILLNAGGFGYYYSSVGADDAAKLRDLAWPLLTNIERRVVFEDVRSAVLHGDLPTGLLMSLVPKLLAHGDRYSIGDALGERYLGDVDRGGFGLPYRLELALTDDLVAPVAKWAAKQYGALARKRGLLPVAGESLDDELTRRALIRVASNDAEIVKRAKQLAPKYRELPASARDLVLPIAARADPAFAAKLRADALVEEDRNMRAPQVVGVFATDDPKRLTAVLDTVLETKLLPIDFLFGAVLVPTRTPAGLRALDAWFRENHEAVLAKFPRGESYFTPFLAIAVWNCEAAKRDETAAFLKKAFASVPGAEKQVKIRIEALDQCIAQRERIGPSLREWLRTAR